MTVWTHEEVGHNQDAKKEVKSFNSDNVFSTPKPERLIQRVLQLATSPATLCWIPFWVPAQPPQSPTK